MESKSKKDYPNIDTPIGITRYRMGLFFLLCLFAGGTSSDVSLLKFIIYAGSILVLAFVFIKYPMGHIVKRSFTPLFCLFLFLGYVCIQLIPLPPSIWTHLSGHQFVLEGFQTLGVPVSWMPISLTPYKSVLSSLTVLPAAAFYMLVRYEADDDEVDFAILAFLVFCFFSALLGISQVMGSPLFNTNGLFNGLFVNENHHVSLMLLAVPFAAMALYDNHMDIERFTDYVNPRMMFSVSLLLIAVIGVFLSASRAGHFLIVISFLAVLTIIMPFERVKESGSKAKFYSILVLAFLIGGGAIAYLSGVFDVLSSELQKTEGLSRLAITKQSFVIFADYMPFGSGLGSFSDIYKFYESETEIRPQFVNHVHNDYFEFILEMGLVGCVILLGILSWFAAQLWNMVRSSQTVDPKVKAATIGLIMVAIHSFVDYPIRTIAISVCFALCAGLVAKTSSRMKD